MTLIMLRRTIEADLRLFERVNYEGLDHPMAISTASMIESLLRSAGDVIDGIIRPLGDGNTLASLGRRILDARSELVSLRDQTEELVVRLTLQIFDATDDLTIERIAEWLPKDSEVEPDLMRPFDNSWQSDPRD